MADGYRYPQQTAGNYYYPNSQQQHNHHQRQITRHESPGISRSLFFNDPPSPSRSPDSQSPAQNSFGMFSQGHQQGQHGRVNGGPGGRGPPILYNYPHQNSHPQQQQQQHNQHHQNAQQEHGNHGVNGAVLGHHTAFSSGLLSNSTPSFTPNALQNGQGGTTRGGQAVQINEHWAEQLKLHKDSAQSHTQMVEQHAPHHYARLKASENSRIGLFTTHNMTNNASGADDEERVRPTNPDTSMRRQDWHNLDLSGQGLRVLATPLFRYNFLHELYVPSNKITYIPASIGQLRHLRYLDASNNQLTELPAELGMCSLLKQLLLFDNNIHSLPNELGFLMHLEMLGVEGNPLDSGTRQEIMDRGTKSLILQLREQAPVPLPPPPRVILDLQDGMPSSSQEKIRVLSYNILCEKYATEQLYGYTPSAALDWKYRREQVLQEVQAQDADVLCFQEIDTESFREYFSMKLAYGDYKGLFWPKSRAKTMSEKDAKAVDGCAIFYKGTKYILLDKQLIDFASIAINRPDMKNQHDIFNRVMPRDHIGVIAFFENRMTGGRIIVVNVHLFHDTAYTDVKVIQTAILMEYVSKAAEKYARWPACKDKKAYTLPDESAPVEGKAPEPAPSMEYTSGTQIPLVICGDFNSTPDSGVYELILNGRMAPDHPDLRKYQYGNFTRDGIQHPFSLRSSYAHLDGTSDALDFTNYAPGFTGILEYIWYSTNTLDVTALLGPLDAEYLKRVPGLPQYHFPSDHICLVSEFSIKGRKEKKTHPEPDFGTQRDRRH